MRYRDSPFYLNSPFRTHHNGGVKQRGKLPLPGIPTMCPFRRPNSDTICNCR